MKPAQFAALLAGPAAFFLVLFFADLNPGHPEVTRMAAVTVWVAIWWLTEATDLAVTALLPFILMPILGIADSQMVAAQYMDQTIFYSSEACYWLSLLNGGTCISGLHCPFYRNSEPIRPLCLAA